MIDLLPKVRGEYRENVAISKICWFGVGGPIDVLYKPYDVADLCHFISHLQRDIKYFIFGVGSNLLVKDEGFRGVGIRLGGNFNFISRISDYEIEVGALVLDANLSSFALENEIGGLEFFSGIPGTIGGAIAMNAGAYGRDVSKVLRSVKAINKGGALVEFAARDIVFDYRYCNIAKDHIFVSAVFQGYSKSKVEIQHDIDSIQVNRQKSQPIRSKTGGSTFKNPQGFSAWKLIDEVGCRGLKIGGAEVSHLHCNFLINSGAATAGDLIELIDEIKLRVFDKFGVMLEEEIVMIV